ncbi:hypothetical protein ASD04_06470 [Devosia sp. Root436]|jgi:ElaB/YqjD/DUF883 family membrane-anchored ribosome-binding protein|uniref:DUF883 family protein n=1 Tax=Devosia sp. Root436 TaxID=1736537 RepID=UPI0006F801AD|nr:DUF883 family protein [Devosia sp. Root436]KQX40272.1 hypothetical protein ASD04_06470 [Devosia sp. Root436]
MATTSDLAPGRKPVAARASRASAKAREAQLEDQVAQLQDDIKAIAATLARLSNDKVNEVKSVAKGEAHNLQRQAEQVVGDVQDQASAMEKQLKDTIREKPLTAVASAVGIGFILALLSRH